MFTRPAHEPRRAHLHALAGTTLATLLLCGTPALSQTIDGVAAQVGTDIVLLSDVLEMTGPVEQRMREAGAPDDEILRLRNNALDRLVEGKILSQMVRRLEMDATEDEIDRAIASIAADSGISVDQLQRSVASHGLTVSDYRRKIRSEIERSKIVNTMVRQRVKVEEDEVRELYEKRFADQPRGGTEMRVRHIMVGFGEPSGRTPEEACKTAEEGRSLLESGDIDFPDLARRISDANGERGGELGWIHRREIARWMASALDPLEAGSVSEVVRTPFGCNLLELVDRRDFAPIGFEQAATQLEDELFRKKMEEEYSTWVNELRAQTFVERRGVFAEASRLTPIGSDTFR